MRVRVIISLMFTLLPCLAFAESYRCDEPKGVNMFSIEGHNIAPDGFTGVKPVVIIGDKEMTISWGDAKGIGAKEKVWTAIIFHRSPESVSGVALDASEVGSAAMLYTIDVKRGYLYLSSHKEISVANTSSANTFVAKCKVIK